MSGQRGYHWLSREDADGVTVVHSHLPRLGDEEASREAFHLLIELVGQAGCSRLVLDLSRAESVDSWAIGQLILLSRMAAAAGGRLALCRLSPEVSAALQAMYLDEVLDIYPDQEQAVASIPTPSPPEDESAGGG